MRTPIAAGQREAEPAHRRAEEPERRPRGNARVQLRAVGRRLLDQHASRGSRSARAARTCPARSGSPSAGGDGGAGLANGSGADPIRGGTVRASSAQTAAGEASTASSAGLRCTSAGIPADDGDTCSALHQRAGLVRVLAEDRRTDRDHEVVGRERPTQPGPVRGQVTCELRVILGEARAGAEGLLPDRAPDALRQRDQRRPCLGIVCPGADHERRCAGGRDELRQSRDGLRVGALRAYDAGGGGVLAGLLGGCSPVVHRHDDEGGAAPGGRLVVGAVDGAGHVLGLQRLVDPDGVLTCEAMQLPGEERLEGEMAPVLLADEHDEGRAIHARRGERADGVSEPCGRVQDRQRRLVPCDRPAGGHPHDGALVQGEHEPEVVRQIREQADLRRPRVCEQRGEPAAPEHVERRVANRPWRHRVILIVRSIRAGPTVDGGDLHAGRL